MLGRSGWDLETLGEAKVSGGWGLAAVGVAWRHWVRLRSLVGGAWPQAVAR